MNKFKFASCLALLAFSYTAHAESSAVLVSSSSVMPASEVAGSTSSVTVPVVPVRPSSGPASVVFTGETKTEAAPQAMTTPGSGVFVTLTRTAYQTDKLPTSAETIKPETFKKFDSQNAGDAIAHATSVQEIPLGAPGG